MMMEKMMLSQQGMLTVALMSPVMMGSPRVVEDIPEIVSTILPDLEMLPEVHASKPSWLMRRSRTPSPTAGKEYSKRQQPVREPFLYPQSKTDKVS